MDNWIKINEKDKEKRGKKGKGKRMLSDGENSLKCIFSVRPPNEGKI